MKFEIRPATSDRWPGNFYTAIASTFARHGFKTIARRVKYRPVMRRALRAANRSNKANPR